MAVRVANWDDLLVGEELRTSRQSLREPPGGRHFRTTSTHASAKPSPQRGHGALRASGRGLEAAARGEHLIVTTGTASGKTLAFNLPVLDALARDPKLRTLYLYPTKALARTRSAASAA